MKKISQIVFSLLVIGMFFYGGVAALAASEDIIATVDGTNITADSFVEAAKYQRFELIQQYNNYVQMYQMYGIPLDEAFNQQFIDILDGSKRKDFGQMVLNQLVYNLILEKEAEKAGITISDQEVTDQLMQMFGISTEEAAPEAESNLGLTSSDVVGVEPEVNKELELQKTIDEYFTNIVQGTFSQDYFRGLVRLMLLEGKLQNEVILKDKVFEAEMVNARHILVETSELADEIIAKLNAGEDWDALAAEHSLDTGNKDSGGALGWFGKGMMVAPFEEAAFATNPGEISQPVKTDFGYHIIAVDGKELRPLEGDALNNAQMEVFQEWYEAVSSAMTVETFDNWEALIPTEPVFVPVEIQPTPTAEAPSSTVEPQETLTESSDASEIETDKTPEAEDSPDAESIEVTPTVNK